MLCILLDFPDLQLQSTYITSGFIFLGKMCQFLE